MQKEPLPTKAAEALKVFTILFVTADVSLLLFFLELSKRETCCMG